MGKKIRDRLSYANLTATLALFLALSGGAVALEGKNTVDSGDIKEEHVRSSDLQNDDVKSRDVAPDAVGDSELANSAVDSGEVEDGTLTGDDLGTDTVTGSQVDEASLSPTFLPGSGALASQIRDLGGGGTTEYGAASGISQAAANMDTVQMVGRAGLGMDLEGMTVHVDTAPGPGESRTFSVVRRGNPDSDELPTELSCTIEEGERFCTSDEDWNINTNLFAIKIESDGAGLPTTDEAYVGLGVGG